MTDKSKELSPEWETFAQALAAVLAKLNEDDFLCLAVIDSDLYLRFSLEWEFGMRVETTSNLFLDEREQLSTDQIADLMSAGWSSPNWTPDELIDDESELCPNYFIDLNPPISFQNVASLAVNTFAETLRVGSPKQLVYFAFDAEEAPLAFPGLGLAFEEFDEDGAYPTLH